MKQITGGKPEHEAAKWVNKETLRSVDWLPADKLILPEIEKLLISGKKNF